MRRYGVKRQIYLRDEIEYLEERLNECKAELNEILKDLATEVK
jgi:translation elongation factor EF-1alpha